MPLNLAIVIVGILSSISLSREDVRVVDPGTAALVEVGLREHVDEDVVERIRVAELVDQLVGDRARPAGGLGGVRAVPIGPGERERAAERVDRRTVVFAVAVGELVLGVQTVVETDVVLALVLWVLARQITLAVPCRKPGVGSGYASESPRRSADSRPAG